MIITLNDQQLEIATRAGERRQEYNLSLGKQRGPTENLDGSDLHPDGCIGEMAVAVHTGSSWVAFTENYSRLPSDVGKSYQVRTTRHPHGGLILHDYDLERHPGQIFILARIHDLPRVELVGWIFVEEGIRDQYWECGQKFPSFKDRPAYLVPGRKLNSMGTLPVAMAR